MRGRREQLREVEERGGDVNGRQGRVRQSGLFRALASLIYVAIFANRCMRVHFMQFAGEAGTVCGQMGGEGWNEEKFKKKKKMKAMGNFPIEI